MVAQKLDNPVLYINGDSHSAAAQAVNTFAFAQDDSRYTHMGRLAHPDNLVVSYGVHVARAQGMNLMCEAESASSNDRIIRSTKRYLSRQGDPALIVIGWSTWDRAEYLHDGVYYQFNSSGPGVDFPKAVKSAYQDWVTSVDYQQSLKENHEKIWEFHHHIRSIPHIFFNTFLPFNAEIVEARDWGRSFIHPYDQNFTYYTWLKQSGFNPVNPTSYYFGPEAHMAWGEFINLQLTK